MTNSNRRSWLGPVLVGIAAFMVSGFNVWVPGPWVDEAVTLLMVQRPWADMWGVFSEADAVHAAHYSLAQFWSGLFGSSLGAIRLMSSVAIGLAAAVVVMIGRRLVDHRTGLLAGASFAILPASTWMGGEARSYAVAALLTALTFWCALVALDTRRNRWWVAYGLSATVAVHVFLFSALSLAVIPLMLFSVRADRARWLGYVTATLAAAVACLPFALVAMGQRGQVTWIGEPGLGQLVGAPRDVWLGEYYAGIPSVIVVVLVVTVLVWLALSLPHQAWWRELGDRRRLVATTLLGWALLPLALAFVVSWLGPNVYWPRYLMTTVPAVALVISLAARSLGRGGVALLLALAVAFLPKWLLQRSIEVKLPTTATAEAVAAAADSSHAQAVLFTKDDASHQWTRMSEVMHPEAFAGLRDLSLDHTAAQNRGLYDSDVTLSFHPERLDGVAVVIAIIPPEPSAQALDNLGYLQQSGFREVASEQIHNLHADWQVVTLQRD